MYSTVTVAMESHTAPTQAERDLPEETAAELRLNEKVRETSVVS